MVGADASSARLVVTKPSELAGLVLTLSRPQMVIGHSDTADLVLEDRFVSRSHALIEVDPAGQVTIRDLNSTGGTFVNEERLAGPRVLQPGDLVRFADLVSRFDPGTSAHSPVADAGTRAPAATVSTDGTKESPGAAPEAVVAAGSYMVTGTVHSAARPGTGGLTVELVDNNVGGDEVLASTLTRGDGTYGFSRVEVSAAYLAGHQKTRPDLQVRVSAGDGWLAESPVIYSAPLTVTLDVELPTGAVGLPSEYEMLTAGLAAAYPGSLGDLREDSGRQDITYLGNKTGWDARAVAMAALADQFSKITAPAPPATADTGQTDVWPVPTVGLQPEFYYALFRAGYPARADALFRATAGTVLAIWQQALTQGVIPESLVGEIPAAVRSFQALSTAQLLSAVGDQWQDALGPDPGRQRQFASLAVQYGDDPEALWNAAGQAFGTDTGTRLRLDAQLAALTLNNAALMSALHEAEQQPPLASVLDLARRGYHQPTKWAALLGGKPLPPSLPGATAEEQRSSYADLLAAQVRVGFPTAVIADLVRTGAAPVRGGPDIQRAVHDFLASRQGEFELGAQPVERFLARSGQAAAVARPVVEEIKRLQRVYQITPSDRALTALLRHDLDSAYKITRQDQASFVRAFGAEMGGADAAAQTYARAQLVYAVTLNVATTHLAGQRAPRLGSGQVGLIDPGRLPTATGAVDGSSSETAPAVIAGPTLEELFGSLDYCQCDDCRSILSPAAYLVDLLDNLDNPPGAPGNPLDVLLRRRPDLQYLSLTCDNTNIAVPYIDLVNEALEYFVCNNLTLAALPSGMAGVPYPASPLSASGGTAPYTWALAAGSTLPGGLTLASDGIITGTPTTGGTTSFTVEVTDSTGLTFADQFSITVSSDLTITAPSGLPDGQPGTPYSEATVTASGGTAPYTWSIPASSSLPVGLALSSYGAITGTPTTGGTTSFTVEVTDSAGLTSTGQLSITINSDLIINAGAGLPRGVVGWGYPGATLTASGGRPPYTWSLPPGSVLPGGLTLAPDGTISGNPTTGGTTRFTVEVTDSIGLPSTGQLSISIYSDLAITSPAELPGGIAGAAYPGVALMASGGTASYTWSLQGGSVLPPGITLAPDGTISGNPTTGGTTSFTVQVTDSTTPTPLTVTQQFTLSMGSPLSVTTSTVPPGQAGASYPPPMFTAAGGTPPYTWSFLTGSALPPGLTLASDGTITGTPTTGGTTSLTVEVTDSASPALAATRQFTLSVTSPLIITTSALPLTQPTVLTASGGTAPYTWSLPPGSALPAGLSLSSDGTITGTPTTGGTTSFTVQVTDFTGLTSTGQLSINVFSDLTVSMPTQLAEGRTGASYPATTLASAGGTAPYTWSLPPGSALPAGLSLDSDGTITGTPATGGTTGFTVQVTDSTTPTPLTATQQAFILVISPLTVTTSALLPGQEGSRYPPATLTASGGTPPYTWSLPPGSALPAGLSLDSGGTITGIPTTGGTTSFTIEVTDSTTPAPLTAIQRLFLSVTSLLIVTTSDLPPGQSGGQYPAAMLTAAGGTPPYTWSPGAGSALPPELRLAPDGAITGTPTTGGTTSFTVEVTDSTGLSCSEQLPVSLASPLSIATGYQGHTTDGSVSQAELLASPQFVIDQAYDTLQETLFPPPLPFHRPLEQLRQYFALFGIPLQDAAVALLADSSATTWTDILAEQLGLSPQEYALLTDHTKPLTAIYGYPNLTDQEAISALSGVQDFCRRISIAYDDLFSILGTRFVNSATALLPRIEALNVPFAALMQLYDNQTQQEETAFNNAMPPGVDPADFGGNIALWVIANYGQINRLITVVDPAGGTDLCSAATLRLRYASPDATLIDGVPAYTLHAIDFVRLLRFIRLWQKLGLSIELTDDIVSALYPASDLPTGNDPADLAHLDDEFVIMLARLGFAYRLLDELGLDPGSGLQQALACWAPIGTTGAHSLYQRIFFASSTLQPDPAFTPDQYGDVLADSSQTLLGHEPALRAALNLTGNEMALIAGALGFDQATSLTLENVSAVYRRGWLARSLRLSVEELLDLINFTGLYPFAPPDLTPPGQAAAGPDAVPSRGHVRLPLLTPPALEPPAIRFVRLIQSIQARSLTPAQALYLMWNHDPSGTAGPTEQDITGLAATLRGGFAAVDSQFTLVNDPNGTLAQQLMALVYGADTTDFFFGLINGTVSTTVAYSRPGGALPPAVLGAASGRLSYDDLRKQLSYAGVLDPVTLQTVESAAGTDTALVATLGALSAANHLVVDPFFATYPELQAAYRDYATSTDPTQVRRAILLEEILRALKPARKKEQALAAVTAAAGTDPSFGSAILEDFTVLSAATAASEPAVTDLTAIEAPGLAAQFYLSNDPAAAADISLDSVPALAYAPCVATVAQTVLVDGTTTAGDVVTVGINGIDIPYNVSAADTAPAILAAHIAQAVNAATAPDPVSGLPLKNVITAAGPPGVITVTPATAFAPDITVTCAAPAPGTGTYTASGQSPSLQATITGTFTADTVLTTTLNGVPVPYTVQPGDTDRAILASNIASAINATTTPDPGTTLPLNQVISAAGPDGAVTIKAVTANIAVASSESLQKARTYTADGPVPASQTATFSGTVTLGDELTSTVNGVAVTYTVLKTDTTPVILAASIAARINETTTTVPGTGQPLSAAVTASAADGTITVTATAFGPDVTLACSVPAGATENYTAGAPVAASQTATLAGAITPGVVLTTTIDGVAIPYTVASSDSTLPVVAENMMATINANTTPDPVSGQPLNTVITASAANDTLTISVVAPGQPFTLECALAPGTYAAAGQIPASATATVSGAITTGDVLTTTVNGVAIPCTVSSADGTVTAAAGRIAAAIEATTTPDPATGQPLNTVVSVSHSGGIITVTAVGAGTTVSLSCSTSPGATEGYSTSPAAPAWQATVNGGFADGDVLTTTVNGIDITYTITADDVTPAIIAGKIKAAINVNATPDPMTGLPLNSLINAVSAGGTVVMKPASPSFTVTCSLSAGATERCTLAGVLPTSPGGGVIAGRWYGYIGVPQDGYYNIQVQTDPGASVSLEIGGAAVTMAPAAGGSLQSNQSPIQLSAASLTPIALTVTSLAATMAVSWESTGFGWQPISGTSLYSGTLIARLQAAYSRFVKVTSLAAALSLTAAEIAYLAADPDLAVAGQPWLNALPVVGTPDPPSQTTVLSGTITSGDVLTTTINTVAVPCLVVSGDTTPEALAASIAAAISGATTPDPLTGLPLKDVVTASFADAAVTIAATAPGAALDVTCSVSAGATETYTTGNPVPGTAAALAGVLSTLLDYARVKAAVSPGDQRLLALVQDPTTDTLTALTGWDPISVGAMLQQLFGDTQITNIGHVANLRRLYDAFTVVTASGISADRLIPAVTTDPSPPVAAALQAAVRSRYAEADWLTVVKPINDTMRDRQRDALVAWVLQQLGDQRPASQTADINTPDKLFEYLLMDVQMEPCAETSRIRHALSSVQLFTEMCLRNLVSQVDPQDIPAGWDWRKRYRLWEANRRVFTNPEDWLDPELRDDQSPFFKQTLGELLQGDMSDDAAATAYLGYLTNLESVAKLEPCGIWFDGSNCDVIACTAGAHRKYYHRQLEGGAWTPWEEIKLGIDDNPVVPYVWNGRLMLFWLKIHHQAPLDGSTLLGPRSDVNGTPTLGGLPYSQVFPSTDQAAGSSVVNVNAILCYSEYANGQWQPVKTSDPGRPTSLGPYPGGTFDRSRIALGVVPASQYWPQVDNDAIWVQIEDDAYLSSLIGGDTTYSPPPVAEIPGFLLYNTHSAPVRGEDIRLPMAEGPSENRLTMADVTGTVLIGYFSLLWEPPINTYELFTSSLPERRIQPQIGQYYPWSSSGGAWFAPFFTEDSRHIFFVTTSGIPPAPTEPGFARTGMTPTGPARAARIAIPPLTITSPRRPTAQEAVPPFRIGSRTSITYNGRIISANGSHVVHSAKEAGQ